MTKLYAKIDQYGVVVKYPYTYTDLYEENDNTQFDDRFDLYGWFNLTEEHTLKKHSLVEVIIQDPPTINWVTERLIRKELPEEENGNYVIKWLVEGRSSEEIDAEIEYKISSGHPNATDGTP